MTWRANQRTLVVVSILLMAFLSPVSAKVIYVDANAPGPTHDGSSWANAYKHLQDALTNANSNPDVNEIRVAQGTYKPDRSSANPNGSGNRFATFLLINGVTLKGGYAGLDQPDPNARDIQLYETILSGDLNGDDIGGMEDPSKRENSYHVVTGSGTDAPAMLDGFTITGGNANVYNPDDYAYGGGMYNSSGSPTVKNCTFSSNQAFFGGGGTCNYIGSNPTLVNCSFTDNSARGGGGIGNWDSNPTLKNCTFTRNVAGSGGGVYNDRDSSPALTDCTFSENRAGANGGGIVNGFRSRAALTNCTFNGNSADTGGAMSNSDSNPTITNSTFSGNSARKGGGMHNYRSNLTVTGCTFSGNLAVPDPVNPGGFGAGMYNCYSSKPTLVNCTFNGNAASESGGGIFNDIGKPNVVTLVNCTFAENSAPCGRSLGCDSYNQYWPSSIHVTNCILWDGGDEIWNNDESTIAITYSDIESGWPGIGNIVTNPCFVLPGYWDPNGTPEDANDDFWIDGDYHLKSQAGRWEPNSQSWVQDYVSSPCIDSANPGCPLGDEPAPNGNRINMGAYGGTAEASKSPPYWRSIADITNDWIVDSNDLKVFVGYWLQAGECIPSDFDRSCSVDSNDFAIFGGQWRQIGPGPGIAYDIGDCIPVDFASSPLVESEPTRFTVTVKGRHIYFEDMMRANCCPEELDVQMTVEDDLITIYEIERFFTRVPCPCLCDFPITATLGPFEPGTYILEVYQDGYFVGTTTVTIENG